MNKTEMIALGLAGLALFLIVQAKKPATKAPAKAPAKPAGWVGEILDQSGRSFMNGWRYFDNGTAIDPAGNYYQDGQMIWQAPGAGA